MFENDKKTFEKQDTSIQEVKYYAAIAAIYSGDTELGLSLFKRITEEPFIDNGVYKQSEIYELIAEEYKKAGDSIAFSQALREGAAKYPKSTYFIPNLINEYIKKEQLDQALLYLDEAIKNDPKNACDFNSVKASIYANKNDVEKAIEIYNDALKNDETCERALEGIGVTYILKAQDLKDKAYKISKRKEQAEMDALANDYYKKAYPILEKYKALLIARNADKADIRQAIVKLRNIYYNLNMEEEDKKCEEDLEKYKP